MDDRYGLNEYGEYGYKGIKPDVETPLDAGSCIVFPANWRDGVTMQYNYRTVLSRTHYGYEQRRPQQDRPLRKQTASILVQQETLADLHLILERLHASFCWWPVYSEALGISDTGPLAGLTTLTVRRSADAFYHMQELTRYVLLAHRSDPSIAEALPLTIALDTTLVLESAVTIALSGEDAILYPAVEGFVQEWRTLNVTDGVAEVEVTFSERLPKEAV